MNVAEQYVEQMNFEKTINKKRIADVIRADLLSVPEFMEQYSDQLKEYVNTPQERDGKVIPNLQILHDHLATLDLELVTYTFFEAMLISGSSTSTAQAIVGKFKHCMNTNNYKLELDTAGHVLDFFISIGVCNYITTNEELFDEVTGDPLGNVYIQTTIELENETYAFIKGAHYLPPMMVKPPMLFHNNDSGLLNNKSNVILGKFNDKQSNHNVGLDVLNILSSAKLSLDLNMLDYEEISKKNILNPIEKQAFVLMTKTSNKVYQYVLDNGNEFYFNWKYDSRGRTYSQGYHVNLQAAEYKKSLINLADKELLNDHGWKALKIDVANTFGLDKKTWEDRLTWFEFNEHQLDKLIGEAKDKYLFVKAIAAYRDAKEGNPIGHIMAYDSTASGVQLMSIMSGCIKSGSQCNLVDSGKREDFYSNVTNKMNDFLPANLQNQYTRAEVKKPIMTHFYGSIATPKKVFGEDTPELAAFYLALDYLTPGAQSIMSSILACWNSSTLSHSWDLPDGHRAIVPVKVEVSSQIRMEKTSARFTYISTVNAPSSRATPLLANVVQSLDGYVVREMVRRAHQSGFTLLTIHDAFYAHPNYIHLVQQHMKDILAELADMPLLDNILSNLKGHPISVPKVNENLGNLIRKSSYAIS